MKIVKSGLNGNAIKLLNDMYKKTRARVKVNGVLYDWIVDEVGMNQGGPNSPNLFRKFLSDLGKYLTQRYGIVISDSLILAHLLWADDLLLLSDTPEGLQAQLDGLYNFCKHVHMVVNETKTKIMVFGGDQNAKFIYNHKILLHAKQYKYLGVLFSPINKCNSNVFTDAYKHISTQAFKAVFKILRDTKHIGATPPNVALQLFDSLVLPILEYGSEVWFCNKEILDIEKVQNKFLKIMLGVRNNTSNLATYGECGRFPLLLRQKVRVIKYWYRIINMDEGSIVKMIYNCLLSLHNCGFKTWTSHVEKLLNETGFSFNWYRQTCDQSVINGFTNCIYESYLNFWTSETSNIENCPKLRLYCTFKKDVYIEPYLLSLLDVKLRKVISQLRLGSHNLEIEKGRHQKPKTPIHERLCKICKSDDNIEDEVHFLMSCPAYDDLRQKFFKIRSDLGLSNVNFYDIITCDKTYFNLAKLLQKMFKRRKSLIN